MEGLFSDLRLALRSLAKRKVFAVVAILSLALGIGANSAIFSLVNGVLLRPLPHIQREGELVRLYTTRGESGPEGVSYPDFEEIRRSGTFEGVMAYSPLPLSLNDGGQPEPLWGVMASDDYFSVLGVQAALGRTFQPGGASEGPVAVLSHGLWQRRFAADPQVVGRPIHLNGQPFTIIGVAPRDFIGTEVIFAPELWIPLSLQPQVLPAYGDLVHAREARVFRTVARLRPGTGIDAASAQARLLGQRLEREFPDTNKAVALDLVPESEARIEVGVGKQLSFAATVFLILVGLVLLIACGNVANLLLARAVARQREISVRLAIGASRGRLIRQLLTESAVLGLLGGACGLVVAFWATRLLGQMRLPTSIPIRLDASLDGRVLFFTLFISLLASLVFGLAPSFQASRPQLVPALKEADARGGGRLGLGKLLVVAQVAVSLVLLVSAGLFLRSLWSAQSLDLGLQPRPVLAASFDLGLHGYSEDRGRRFFRDLTESVRSLPGVRSVSLAAPVPLDYMASGLDVVPVGGQLPAGEDRASVLFSAVAPDYFETVGTPLLQGRPLDRRDEAGRPRVAVVNETLAQRFWPGRSPLGQQLRIPGQPEPIEVVGLVGDGKYRNLVEEPTPYMFLPLEQSYTAAATLLVRSDRDPASLLSGVRGRIRELDPELAIADARSLADLIGGRTLLPMRLAVLLAGAFGLLGLVLSATGLYSLLAHTVSRRTREIGIRMALGARSADVLRLVLRQGLTLTFIGLAAGLVLTLLLARPLSGLLMGVSAVDPPTLLVVAAGLSLVALLASWVPARRAARVDPIVSIKYE